MALRTGFALCAGSQATLRETVNRREHKIPWGVGGLPVLVQASRMDIISNLVFGRPMRVQIQLRIVSDDDTVLSEDVIACFDKGDDQLEEIGLSLEQAKTVLAGAQTSLVAAQAASFLARHRCCERCGRHLQSKGHCRLLFRTAFGTIPRVSPRVHRCVCQSAGSKTFSPLTALFTGHTAPELLYLETRWASLMSFGLTAGLLKDVLPVDVRTNAATIRNHLHKVALRQEAELGDERPRIVEGDPAGGKELPMLEGPIVVGIDGAYLRSWHGIVNLLGGSRGLGEADGAQGWWGL